MPKKIIIKPNRALQELADKLNAMRLYRAATVFVPVMRTQRMVLQSCSSCIFHGTNACHEIDCMGKFADVLFKIA